MALSFLVVIVLFVCFGFQWYYTNPYPVPLRRNEKKLKYFCFG